MCDIDMSLDNILVGYRGRVSFDVGVVYTPYIPMTVTRTPIVPRIRRIGADGRIEEQIDGVWMTRSKGREVVFETETEAYLYRIGI